MTDQPHFDLMERLRVALQVDRVTDAGGRVKAGEDFAASLLVIVGHPACKLPDPIREAAVDLANETRGRAVAHRPKRRGTFFSPVDGLRYARQPAPIFCAVVRHRREPDSFGWLRVALIEYALAALVQEVAPGSAGHRSPLSASDCETLQRLLYEPLLETGGEALYELIQSIGTQLSVPDDDAGLEELRIPEAAVSGVATGDRGEIEQALGRAYAHLRGTVRARPAQVRTPPARKPKPPRPVPPRGPLADASGTFELPKAIEELRQRDPEAPLHDFVDAPMLAWAPIPADVAVDEGDDETDQGSHIPAPSDAKAASGRRDARNRHSLYLSGSLQPEVQRTLTPPEYRAVMSFTAKQCRQTVAASPLDAAPWVILLLSGLTSRHHVTTQYAIEEWLRGVTDEPDGFRISEQGFWSRMPIKRDPNRKSDHAPPPSIFLWWPQTVQEILKTIAESREAWTNVLDGDLTNSIHEASQTIRTQIDARFSLLRLRNSLAPALYVGTGDEALAQIVTGDAMHHSDAPLHYYSHKVGRIRRAIAWSLGDWLPSDWKWVVPIAADDEEIFGMPRARLADDEIRCAISALASRADQSPPPRADARDLCEFHQRLTAYVAALFAACTTHRFTEHLRQLTRRHLLLRWTGTDFGLAIFVDKYTVNALSCRGVTMAALLVRQIELYLAHLDRLRRRLDKNPHRNRFAIEALTAAIEGRGPLFVHLEHDEKDHGKTQVRPFEAGDLQRLWPEWRWPAYVLRHRFASFHWRHMGVSRDDVMRQMGHASDGVAFDEGDPDSVLRFASRMADPLSRALEQEGWRQVRSWMPERVEVPDMGPDSCAATLREQAALTTAHAKLQREATARAMGKWRVERAGASTLEANRESIFETARDLARTGLETWMQHPDQAQIVASKVLRVEDVSRLADAVTATLPDRRHWIPAVNVLRNRLQRLRTDAGWTLDMPPAIYVLDVASPVITPACARAFIHCTEVLRLTEQAILQCGLDQPLERGRWLAITAVQLAVRCGVTRPDYLIAVLANAASARRHPFLPDTLLVAIDEPIPTATEAEGDDPDEDPSESTAQYVTVQGLAAICLERWRSIVGNIQRETLQKDLAHALQLFIPDGASTVQGALLDDFLKTAALARRLTMPGSRASWEEGRLASRTLPLDRQIDAWRGVIRRQVEDTEAVASEPDDDRRIDHSAPTAAFLEAARLCIGIREGEKGQPRSATTVAGEIAVLATQHGPLAPTARWIQQYLLKRLRNIRPGQRRSTLYQDYTTFLTPFLLELGDLDLADLTSVEQTELFERVLSDRVTDAPRALQVILGIVREMNREGIDGPDRQALESIVGRTPKVPKAYLVTPSESRWICEQLGRWLEEVRGGDLRTSVSAFDIDAARVIWDLQFWIGLRTSENTQLRHAEVIELGGEWILQIRRIRRRGLKTSASVRPLRLRHFLPAGALDRFKRFVALQRAAFAGSDHTVGLFVPPSGRARVASTRGIIHVASTAMRSILPVGEGRPYAGRHARASYGLQMVLPEEHRSTAWRLDDAPSWPAYLALLPLRFQLRFLSRALGHAVVRSTLEYYAHSLGDLNWLDRGWPTPTLALLGCAGGVKPMTLGSRASRARIGVDERDRIVGLMIDESCGQDGLPPADVPDFAPIAEGLSGRDDFPYALARLADVAREWLRGDRLAILQHRYGIGEALLLRFVRALERLDYQYRTGIVDRRIPLDGIDSRHLLATRATMDHRGPRRHLLVELATAYDDLRARQPIVWQSLCAAIAEQRNGLDGFDLEGLGTAVLAELRALFGSLGMRLADPSGQGVAAQRLVPAVGADSARLAELSLVHLIILARGTSPAGMS